MTEQELINAIIDFNNDADVQRLQNLYNSPTFLDILAVSRRELCHSAFLAWLFNMSANHGLGTIPILQLLELFVGCSRRQNKELDDDKELADALRNAILSRVITIHNTHITTEYNIQDPINRGRADIVIDSIVDLGISDTTISKLRIVIENKVYAKETKKQTCTYHNYYENERQDGEEIILYIYLTPLLHEKPASCDKFVHITYQDLLDNVFEPILLLQNLSERTRFILTEYINCLSIPVEEFNNKKEIKRTTIMAISKTERNLLEAFWEKHRTLIMAVLTEITTDPDSDEDQQEDAKALLNKLNSKDYSKYSVNGVGAFGKSPLVREVVKCYLDNNSGVTIDKLKKVFPDALLKGSRLGVVRSQTEINSKDYKRYKELTHSQIGTIYICTQWKIENIERFINHVNDNIPGITIARL